MPGGEFHVLGPLRHRCFACGGGCQGMVVWLRDEEQAHLRALAEDLEVGVDPVDDRRIRYVDGRCVFLEPDGRCRIHARRGLHEKPLICRQYPVVVVRTEGGLRAGVDPGCYAAWRTWQDGPEVPAAHAAVNPRLLPPPLATHEEWLLDLLQAEDASLVLLGAALAGASAVPPPGMAARFAARLRAAEVAPLLERPGTSAWLREHLHRILTAVPEPALASWPLLDPDAEAFALDAIRRMLFLRLGSPALGPVGNALLLLLGAVAAGWADPDPEGYGPLLSAWTRAIRSDAFWFALAPSPASLQELATGP